MPIKAQSAKRQVLRFQGLPFWDQKRQELEAAYQEAFASDFDAEDFTQEWLKAGHECPVPADVWIAATWRTANRLAEERRTGFKCEICQDVRFLPADDVRDGSIGFSRRCVCNPETDESRLRGYFVERKKQAEHPEIALGIPSMVVTAKPAFKLKYAKTCNYSGPLTIAEAVRRGIVARDNAIGMIKYWLQEGGEKPTADRLLETL